MRRPIRKKSYFLLEVMLALTLLSCCFIPLIKPHCAIRKAEQKYIDHLTQERIAHLAFCEFKTRLFEHHYSWKELYSGLTDRIDKYPCEFTVTRKDTSNKTSLGKKGLLLTIELRFDDDTIYKRTLFVEAVS